MALSAPIQTAGRIRLVSARWAIYVIGHSSSRTRASHLGCFSAYPRRSPRRVFTYIDWPATDRLQTDR